MRDKTGEEFTSVIESAVKEQIGDKKTFLPKRKILKRLKRQIIQHTSENKQEKYLDKYRKGKISRRKFLKILGVSSAAAISASAGIGWIGRQNSISAPRTPTGSVTRDDFNFDQTLNAVKDLGMDPNGNEIIDDALTSAMQDNTIIEFPPGTYLLGGRQISQDVSNWGIRGTGSSHRDVVFTAPAGNTATVFGGGPPGPLLFENFAIDERDDEKTAIAMNISCNRGAYMGNIEWLGVTPLDSEYPHDYQLGTGVGDQDAVTVIENVSAGLDQPSVPADYPEGTSFQYAGPSHQGEIIMRNCRIHERNSTATRATNIGGVLTIEGCEFVNNQNSNIRFAAGEHPNKVSSARNCYVKIDGSRNCADAVRIESSNDIESGSVFENLHIAWTKSDARGIFAVPSFQNHGSFTIRGCVVRNDGNGDSAPTVNASTGSEPVTIEDSHFTGSGGDLDAQGRDGSVIRNCCIDMPNAEINGFDTQNISRSGCQKPQNSLNFNSNSSSNQTSPNNLTISSSGEEITYLVISNGGIEKSTLNNGTKNKDDAIFGNTATGTLQGGDTDSYKIKGQIIEFQTEGNPDIKYNGKTMTVQELQQICQQNS